jgi:hypothetical protein
MNSPDTTPAPSERLAAADARRTLPGIDCVAVLAALGARWSPDLDAYTSGQPGPFRCALCTKAPCQCRECPATHENTYYLATGRPQFEPCGMTVDPATGECPRGHRAEDGDTP